MNERKADKNNGLGKGFSIIFGVVLSAAVLACLVGMIYCFISFIHITRAFNSECREILIDAASVLTPSDDMDSASIVSYEESSDRLVMVDSLIAHMENIVAIQESGTTNSLMSFVYGILSSILVGLCAKFVATSRNSADEAKKTADFITQKAANVTDKMREALKKTEEITEVAKMSAENAEKRAAEAEHKIKQANDAAALAIEKATEAETAIEKVDNAARIAIVMKYQARVISIIIKIVSGGIELLRLDKISATRLIKSIQDETFSLLNDEEFKPLMLSDGVVIEELGIVYDELYELQQKIDTFIEICKEKYSGRELASMEKAAENYHNWVKNAIDYMDDFCKMIRNPVR